MFILIILAIICCALAYYFKQKAKEYEEQEAKKPTNKKRPSELLFRLVTTAPFGLGTLYDFSVFNNGHVTYLGHEENAPKSNYKPGFYEFNLDKDELKQLGELYNKINIGELEDSYDCDITDIGTHLLTFLVGDVGSMYTKEVSARCNYPEELDNLIKFVNDQINVKINKS